MSRAKKGATNFQWWTEHPATWREETMGLSFEAKGLYADLKAIYWINSCQLPDGSLLKRRLGLGPGADDSTLRLVLDEFFPDGSHAYLDEQYEAGMALSAKRAAAGKRGGDVTAGKAKKPDEQVAPVECQEEPQAPPVSIDPSIEGDEF